jgi:hypothetical protein
MTLSIEKERSCIMTPEVKITKKAMVEISVCGWNPEVCGELCIFLKQGRDGDSLTAKPFFICRLFKNHKKKPKETENFLECSSNFAFRCKRCLKLFGKAAKIINAMQYHH